MWCPLLLVCANTEAEVAAPAPTTHGGKPLPARPAGDASAGLEYTWIGDSLGGANATYAFAQHAAILPKDGVTMTMQDAVLGGASNGGFAYQLDVLFGVGHWFGAGGIGLAGGVGVDGITGHRIPFGVRIPLRAWATVDAGPALRFEASGEIAGETLTPDRRGHELVGRFGVYIGGRAREAGCFVGFTARRAMDTTLLTVGLGVGLAAAAID